MMMMMMIIVIIILDIVAVITLVTVASCVTHNNKIDLAANNEQWTTVILSEAHQIGAASRLSC